MDPIPLSRIHAWLDEREKQPRHLRRSDPFGFLTEEEAQELADELERERIAEGQPMMRERKPGELTAQVKAAGGWEKFKAAGGFKWSE